MPEVTANGIRMYYEWHGDGPPLVLINGLGANHLGWQAVLPQLTQRNHCLIFDNRGVGHSEILPGPWTIEQMADDVSALMQAVGLDSADCLGYSLGGSVLQALCYRHPHRVRRAVLLSTLARYTAVQHGWLDGRIALQRAGADALTVELYGMPWSWTQAVMSNHAKAAAYARLSANNPLPRSLEGVELQGAAIRVYDSRPHLPDVNHEVLVLVGAEDILTPVHQAVEIAELIPKARLVVAPRGGHGALYEYTADIMRAIRDFLA